MVKASLHGKIRTHMCVCDVINTKRSYLSLIGTHGQFQNPCPASAALSS